jgi:hypothetical protein
MQLNLKSLDVMTSHDMEVRVILNGVTNNSSWVRMANPSLSQVVYHAKGDTVTGGATVFQFRAVGGLPDSLGRRISTTTTQILTELLPLGNSILGGDGVYPDGPDTLTVVASCIDYFNISNTNMCTVAARLSWTESQA